MKYNPDQMRVACWPLAVIILLALAGCGSLKSENEKLKEEIVDVSAENEKLRKELNARLETELVSIELEVNKIKYKKAIKASMTLLDFLREDLGLKRTKKGCDSGQCGACNIIMDGKTINACLVLAIQADGKEILTIEGLSPGGRLHPLQEAFAEEGAVQCGFCVPGMVLSAKALLEEKKDPLKRRSGRPFQETVAVAQGMSRSSKPCKRPLS